MRVLWRDLRFGLRLLLGSPALGRTFTREEEGDRMGAYPVAVISYEL